MKILFHASCADGFCAAWLLQRSFSDAEFIPVQYGQPLPDIQDREIVLIADFSYDRETMIELNDRCVLSVYDHHKTAEEDCKDLGFCRFDSSKCGARLVAEAFNQDSWLLDYIEDRDLWKWQMPNSREISAALQSYPMDFEVWDDIERRGNASLVGEGTAILRYQRQLIDSHKKHAIEIVIDGHKVLAVPCTAGTIASQLAQELAWGRPFGVCYFDKQDGGRVFSLRSKGDFDVSAIAKNHGGGGHKNAAGFTVSYLGF